jgi:hypothetical protein
MKRSRGQRKAVPRQLLGKDKRRSRATWLFTQHLAPPYTSATPRSGLGPELEMLRTLTRRARPK